MIPFFKTNFRILLLFLLVCFTFNASAQSINNIENIKVSELSNSDIHKIKNEMDKQNMTLSTLENLAITKGMSAADFATLKTRIENLTPEVNASNVEKGVIITEKPIELDERNSGFVKNIESIIFGSEIFDNPSLSFEPNSNSATPSNYILGPGDELQIVIYGMQEFSASPTVSREGKISLPIIGQIFVSGLTFEAAKSLIKKSCSKIYGSLNSGQSSLSMSLSKIRTIKITIIGAKKPGNYSVSSLSTVFNALHIAGGPDGNGSFRNIELIRNNKVVRKIDIYKFLTTGNQSDNVNLLDNDVIRIPIYENRVKVEGKVKQSGIFELLPNETFLDLLKYCSGFDESAYKANIKLVQNTEKELKIIDLNEEEYKKYIPKSGDVFKISSILNRFENRVSIKGSVFRPDDYSFYEGMTLKDLLLKADGLTEDAFKNRAVLIREMPDLTKEIENVNLNLVLNGSLDIKLRKNDELVISSVFDLKVQHTVSISGQVKKQGDYPFIETLTVYDLILLSGGFNDGASKVIEISSVIISDEKKIDQLEHSTITTIEIDTSMLDQSKNIFLKPFDIVQVRKKPIFETQKTITVIGEVLFPGSYTISNNNERFLDFIQRAGGLKSSSNIEAIYVIRKVDRVSTQGTEKIEKKIPIDYKRIVRSPTISRNIVLKPGDEIIVKKLDETVKVFGNVYLSSEIAYISGKRMKYYINSVGGFNENTNRRKIYVINGNGLAKTTKKFLFFKKYPKIKPGSEIIVPTNDLVVRNPNKMSSAEIATISAAFASIGGMAVAIINLLTK